MPRDDSYSAEQLRAVAYMAAGAASAVWMKKFPHEVMPTEEITEAVVEVLKTFYPGTIEEVGADVE